MFWLDISFQFHDELTFVGFGMWNMKVTRCLLQDQRNALPGMHRRKRDLPVKLPPEHAAP